MTVPTRGPRIRRGGRRPGWALLTALLIMAILASSALVFTNRVELLKLAVILSLWAAVVAAFVSVIYRRQSDADQAKARDMKFVYDLQLDREISARREYELTLETHLRRELASEARAQAADEVAALRVELAAMRANLEILFDTDLSHRPAIGTDRPAVRAYSEWAGAPAAAGRVASSRIDTEDEVAEAHTDENPIIDVPEEPEPQEPPWTPSAELAGAHRRPSEEPQTRRPKADKPRNRRRRAEETPVSPPPEAVEPPKAPPDEVPEPTSDEPQSVADSAVGESTVPPQTSWQPAPADGSWIPAGTPGSNWVSPACENGSAAEYVGRRRASTRSAPTPWEPPRARHLAAAEAESPEAPPAAPEDTDGRSPDDEESEGQHTGGQSVAELLARLQASPTGAGRRRRRDE